MKDAEWVLVMNASRARVVRGLPLRGAPAEPELVLRAETRRLREIMADRPGRSFSSGARRRRSAMEYASDPVREDERAFVRQVVALLEAHRLAGEFNALSVVAGARMLGLLREAMPRPLAALVRRECRLNLADVDEAHLPERLRQALRQTLDH